MSSENGAFGLDEPGVGKFILYNLIFSIGGVAVLVLLEKRVGFNMMSKIQERILLRNNVHNKIDFVYNLCYF
jgi:hypothetical protein